MHKNKVKTFDELSKPITVTKGKQQTIVKGADLFQHLILVGQTRNIDLKKILSYELAAVPSRPARPDGT